MTDNRQGRKATIINDLNLAGSIEIIVALSKMKKINNEKAANALKILKEEGWFDLYIIEMVEKVLKTTLFYSFLMRFSRKELVDFGKAWLIVSFAFAIVFRSAGIDFFYLFLASGLTVGVGFLLHELAHKIVAQMYGYWAEFRSDDKMLLLALIMSFFGFVFAAPGGVLIPAIADKKKTGLIALAGPLVNVFLALLFFGLDYFYESGFFVFGSHINSFIAVFNLIPFAQFDGEKIFAWNKFVWGSCLAIAGVVLGIVLYLQI